MKTVTRHSLLVRLNHWLVAVSGILLLFSGFGQMPMYNRYYVTAIPGFGWSGDFALTLYLHYAASVVFVAAVIFHMIYHAMMGEFGVMPKKGDIKEGIQGLKAMIGLAEEPRHDKFQAKQRLAYLAIGATSLVLILTGLVKSYKNLGNIVLAPSFLEAMALIHTAAAVFFMILFVIHVGIMVMKNHRPLITSMVTGKVSTDYARHHHPAWKVEG